MDKWTLLLIFILIFINPSSCTNPSMAFPNSFIITTAVKPKHTMTSLFQIRLHRQPSFLWDGGCGEVYRIFHSRDFCSEGKEEAPVPA